jgi:hypothetical protein
MTDAEEDQHPAMPPTVSALAGSGMDPPGAPMMCRIQA